MLEANWGRKMATRAEVLRWIYNRMVAGEAFVTAREEARGMFEIIERSEKEKEDTSAASRFDVIEIDAM